MNEMQSESSARAASSGAGTLPGRARWLPRTSFFIFTLLVLLVAYFTLLRVGLVVRNHEAAASASASQLAAGFLTGIRFDVSAACFLLLPFTVLAHLPLVGLAASPRFRRLFFWVFTGVIAFVTLLLLAEYEFFKEFQTRFNQAAFDYLDHGATVAGMLWYNYPILRYLLVWTVLVVLFALPLRLLLVRIFRRACGGTWKDPVALGLVLPLLVVGVRGGLQDVPLQWGDAYQTDSEFANQIGLNGVYALVASEFFRLKREDTSRAWSQEMSLAEARSLTRALVLAPGDTLVDPAGRTVLRTSAPGPEAVTLRKGGAGHPPNVVLVVMESFSARYCGAVGADKDLTPCFDELARDGVLFDRAFSSGTFTHPGLFSSAMGFPNLPGYEHLMEDPLSNQPFATLPALFKKHRYQTLFLYNADFAWDNMRGFFRKQGVDTFIGGDDYVRPTYHDKVWGVADGDVFQRANEEFARADQSGPFFAIVLTLSNHSPFGLPKPLPFTPTTDMGELNQRVNSFRYADWALGQFMAGARKLPYFANTLFVFVGDHGFSVQPVLTESNLLFHHVPLLFYSPELLSERGRVLHTPACQTNIAPSILGLAGIGGPQACWSRDLFRTDYTGENFAVFKGAGGSKEVAMVRGDKVLVLSPDGRRSLHTYSLAFPPSITPVKDPSLTDEMERQLRAYVHAALADLEAQKAGPVSEKDR